MNEQTLRKALQNGLSGIEFDPARQRAVLESMEKQRPAPRKLSLVIALALATMLLAGTAVAAGLGLFGRFAESLPEGGASTVELGRLEDLAVEYNDSRTITVDGRDVTLTLRQAYCDGLRLYYTYEIDNGMTIGDGAKLLDGRIADIYESGEVDLEDGTRLGYQTVQLPEGAEIGDTLTFQLYVGWELVPFTIDVGEAGGQLTGSAAYDLYTAEAKLRKTTVVLQGSVLLNCPKAWTDSFGKNGDDVTEVEEGSHTGSIINFVLTNGSRRWYSNYTAIGKVDDGLMEIDLLFDLPEDLSQLALIPVYAHGGEYSAETIPLTYEEP